MIKTSLRRLLNYTKTLLILFAICLQLSAVNTADHHSLNYYFTTISPPGPGQPNYHVGGSVNDVRIVRYTSETHRVQPLLSCLEESMDPQHWVNQTHIAKYYENRHQQIINYMKRKKLLNHEKGHRDSYVFQVKFWCELSGDKSISGYEEFAANGDDFIVLDTSELEFVALISSAQTLAKDWNSRFFGAKRQKSYMEQECIMWLKQYLECECVTERLRTVRPQVKVSSQQLDGAKKLHCQVYGFYPRAVDVKWMRNKSDVVLSDEVNKILPNPDGTYQTRVSVTVELSAGEKDGYSCYVDHSSLEEILHVPLESKTSRKLLPIGIIIAIFVILPLTIIVLKNVQN